MKLPIYGYGTNGAPWSICTDLPVKKLAALLKIFNRAIHEFKYRNDQAFVHSIDINIKMDEPYIAKYDYSKCGLTVPVYQEKMTELIQYANGILVSNYRMMRAYDNYKIDIQGTWTIGKIVIMKRNSAK